MGLIDRITDMFAEDTDQLQDYRRVLLPTTRHDLVVTGVDGFHVDVVRNGERMEDIIDATSQVGTNPLGHRYGPLLEELRQVYRDGSDFPLMLAGNDSFHPLQRKLAEKFTDIYPGNLASGQLKTYYCNSGSEAVERGCLKTAQLYSGGNSYVNFDGAFHGRTSLALSHTNSKKAHTEGYNFLARTLTAPFATESGGELHNDPEENVKMALARVERLIEREGSGNVNSMMVEPLQGEGGYNVPHPLFMKGLREIATENDIPFIVDEVQASLRTGRWFGIENFDVQPDMIPVAKAFSGGVTPFGASLIRDEFATEQEGKHSSTFGGNPKECLVALKTIQLIEQNGFLENAEKEGRYLSKRFDELEAYDIVHESRGIGLFRGIEFRRDGKPAPDIREKVIRDLLENQGVWTEACGNKRFNTAIRFLLPVNVTRDVTEQVADAVEASVKKVAN